MPRTVGLVLLLLLCATATAGTLQSEPAVGQTATAGDVGLLTLDDETRTTITSQSIDVSTAVATQQEAAQTRLSRHSLAVAFERAEDEQARRELLFEAATEVEIDISELRTEQRDLRASYVAGEIPTETFLTRQAVMDARAEQLRLELDEIREFADRVPRLSMRSRLQTLESGLTGFGGPVSTRVTETMAGEQPPIRVYVSASESGTVFSTVEEDQFVREGFRSDRWAPDSTTSVGLDALEARAGELYPIAFNSSQTTSRGIEIVSTGIYRIGIGYEQGEIVAYLDGDTEEVFYEIQRQPLQQIQAGSATVAYDNGIELSVNRTFAGGPLRISTVDALTDEPIDATIVVGGQELQTGSDGVVWTLMPAQETQVTAITSPENTTVTVIPM